MKDRAYAKINLCLDVVRRREDGYHDLRMIMVPLDFYDLLEMEKSDITSLTMNRSYLPADEKNTVIKAIRVMQRRYGIRSEYSCHLTKHIPSQAGLAGGSADAASAIRMINEMENLRLSTEELIAAGKEVGADVPFCILNRPALVEGIGEKITPFECKPDFHVMLVKPKQGVSTASAFGGLNFETIIHPDADRMKEALETNDYDGVIRNLGNSLEEISIQLVREIRDVKEEMQNLGFDGVLMSGSGSTVFGLTKDIALLERANAAMKNHGYFVRSTKIKSVDSPESL